MKKVILAATAIIIMASSANAYDGVLKEHGSATVGKTSGIPIAVGVIGGVGLGAAFGGTVTTAIVGGAAGGAVIVATQPKLRDKTTRISNIVLGDRK